LVELWHGYNQSANIQVRRSCNQGKQESTRVSGNKVDLTQIRGDWDFHSRYVCNAMEQTLKRTNRFWKALKKASSKKGQVPVDGLLMDEFIEVCMQTRAITDDFLILAECKTPGKAKSGAKDKPKNKKKAKSARKSGKKSTRKSVAKAGGKK
jgi:hypothetical protein